MHAYINIAMHSVRGKFANIRDKDARVVFKPTQKRSVVANRAFPPKQLVLVAFSPNIFRVGSGKVPEEHVALNGVRGPIGSAINAYITPVRQGPVEDGKLAKPPIIVPFWYVKTTVYAAMANMKCDVRTAEVMGTNVDIPVYVNTAAVKKGQELVAFKP